jgi:hypothetical protein
MSQSIPRALSSLEGYVLCIQQVTALSATGAQSFARWRPTYRFLHRQ